MKLTFVNAKTMGVADRSKS